MNHQPGESLGGKLTSILSSYAIISYSSCIALVAASIMLAGCAKSSSTSPTDDPTGLKSSSDTTPPHVLSIDPKIHSTDIAKSSSISVSFSEALDPQTVSSASLILLSGLLDGSGTNQPVNGTVSYSDDGSNFVATFKPNADLAPNATYTALVTKAITDVAGNRLDRLTTTDFTTVANSTKDTTPPAISATLPVNGGVDIATNRAIIATFSEAMTPGSITASSFTLQDDSTKAMVSGTVSYSGNSAKFTPAAPLASGTMYNATITSAVTDLAGHHLPADYNWSFTTAAAGGGNTTDTTRPGVSVVTPRDNAIDIAINSAISASFDEPLNPDTVTTSSFSITGGGSAVSGSVAYNGTTATFKPDVDLATGTTYTATLTTAITDLAGNALTANYSWSFKTSAAATPGDTTPPTITAVSPMNGAIDVALNGSVSVDFSEALNPATVNTASFLLTGASGTVAGSVTYNGTSATFTPLAALDASTVYTAILTASISDLAGNTLTSNYAWSFTTAALADTTAPTVVSGSEVPANGATDVAINAAISVSFDEALSPGTVNTSTFLLTGPAGPVAGSVRYSGTTATFTPLANLQNSSSYTAIVTTGITDLAGNALATAATWTFTTTNPAVPPDTTAPSVVPGTLSPASGAVNVPVTSTVSAQFSEALDPSTVTSASVSLRAGGFPVAGSVLYSNNTITFVPSANLAFNSNYTITINNSVTDLAGNPLTTSVSWSFTTIRAANGGGMGGGNSGGGMGGGGGG